MLIILTGTQSVCRSKAEYKLELQSKRDELEKWEARLKIEGGNVDPLKLDNKKLVAELSEQRMLMERLQTQIHEATLSESGAQKLKVSWTP